MNAKKWVRAAVLLGGALLFGPSACTVHKAPSEPAPHSGSTLPGKDQTDQPFNTPTARVQNQNPVPSTPSVDSAEWDGLLKGFVNERHRVEYARWKKEGMRRLDDYVFRLGQMEASALTPYQKKALLINAYNAFTIQWVLENYPIAGIWRTDAPFTQARHRLRGKMVSLDEIESELRAMGDPRIHAALVCAARSCPPLRREAYVPERLDEQLDDNVRQWLANSSLDRFYPAEGRAEVSPIFKWDRKDFELYPGGLVGFLGKYAPPQDANALEHKPPEIRYLNYDWGLNDESEGGQNYSRLQFAIDWLENWFRGLAK
jgi:Protein of unknown function, DUF547